MPPPAQPGAELKIVRLYISGEHNFVGHHGKPPGETPIRDVAAVECVAGQGLRGDRFFGFKENYKGQITFFSLEVHRAVCERLGIDPAELSPSVYRRNVLTSGADLNALIGGEFEVQGVRFRGIEECAPCYWMNQALGPGAEEALKGQGGLRAHILSDGHLRIDAETDAESTVAPPVSPLAPS